MHAQYSYLFLHTDSLIWSDHRLTFWLSNSVVLRATITKFHGQQQIPLSADSMPEKTVVKDKKKKFSPLKWESCSSNDVRNDICESLGNWEDPVTFIRALEKIEAWIFSRIIESIWWQVSPSLSISPQPPKAQRHKMNPKDVIY